MNTSKKQKQFKEIFDDKGKPIKDIVGIITYLDGFVVATKKGLYTNVKGFIKSKN